MRAKTRHFRLCAEKDAGMMIPLHSFAKGNEGAYRLTDAASNLRDGLISPASRVPSEKFKKKFKTATFRRSLAG